MIPKYRAWDKKGHRMILPKYLYSIDLLEEQVTERTKCNYTFSLRSIPFDRVELMQSTGLFDRNGKEIFEGDVLEIQGIKMIVRFGSYNYIETSRSGNHTLGIMCDGLGFYVECLNVAAPDKISPFEPETLKESVVIGNIYESQELLEEEK